MKYDFSKDLYRYYGEKGETLAQRILRPPELKYIALMRKTQNCKFFPLKWFYTLRLKRMSYKTLIQIPPRTRIGDGFYIGHSGRVIIHPEAVIGENANVATGVTIGQENRGKRKGAPTIGDNCWIGGNTVICPGVKVGNGVVIGAGSVVTKDIPDNVIAAGNPCRVIRPITDEDKQYYFKNRKFDDEAMKAVNEYGKNKK